MNPSWLYPENCRAAQAAQKEMAQNIVLEDLFEKPIVHVAGVDVSHQPFDPEHRIFGAIVVLAYPSLEIVETVTQAEQQKFPYIPGLLGFREAPVLVHAFHQLSIRPDIMMVDGHGISHPRGLGIASHLGVLLDIPTLGVAKSILIGTPKEQLAKEPGSTTSLIWKEKEVAMMLRTKKRCLPLIISAGHKITPQTACHMVVDCLRGYRLPEPTRHAHLAANHCRQQCLHAH